MSASSYSGSELAESQNYSQLLGFIEFVEGYKGLAPDAAAGQLYYDSVGIPTIGYGFALINNDGSANVNTLAAVLDGLVLNGKPYIPGQVNDNVNGGYLGLINGKPAYDKGFAPIGYSIGIFQYKSAYYFETSFNPDFGDFYGRRRNDTALRYVLGVFEHRANRTREICEYESEGAVAAEFLHSPDLRTKGRRNELVVSLKARKESA